MKNKKKKEKKSFGKKLLSFIKALVIIGLIIIVFLAAVNIIVVSATKNRIISSEDAENGEYDCIIVLGAGVRSDGSPSNMLEDRLKVGIDLLEKNASSVILMSGDHGREEYDEVNCMKDYAIDAGVDEDVIFLDHAGFSTYDSVYRARDVFGAKKVLIVTQKYHLYRALYIADQLGLEAYGVGADVERYYGQLTRNAREAAARVKDFLYCVVRPEPTYLGEVIPVSGDGDLTND